MFLKKLLLEHFTCHEDRELKFTKPVTLIMGPNASGKSSVKDGFEWLLTGATRSTDAGGRGFESLIRTGEKEMTVSAELGNGDWEIMLSRTANGKGTNLEIEGWQGTRKILEETLYSKLGTNGGLTKGQIHALLNSTYFFQLLPADQRAMLFEALGLDFTKDALLNDQSLFPDGVSEEARRLLTEAAETVSATARGAKVIEQLDQALREERRMAKRTLDTLKKQSNDRAETEVPENLTTASKDQAESLLADLRKERDALLARKTKLEEAQSRRKSLEDESRQLERDYDAKAAEYKRLGKPIEPPKVDQEKVAQLEKQIAILRGELATEDWLPDVKARVLAAGNALRCFKEHPGKCVILPSEECHLSGESSGALTALEASLKRDRAEVTTLESSIARIRTILTDLTAKHTHALNPPTPQGPSQDQVASLEDTLERLGKQIEAKSAEIAELLKLDTAVPASLEVDLKSLNERIAKGEQIVEQIIRREEVEKHIDAKKEQVGAAKERVDILEDLVKMFGPDGIAKQMLAEKLASFKDPVQWAVTAVTGGRYTVDFNKDLAIEVMASGEGGPLPVENLSSSEGLRIGVGIQLGLAKALGFPLIVIDNADMLDPANRAFFSGALYSFATDGYQVIVLATGEPPEGAEASETVEFVQLRG